MEISRELYSGAESHFVISIALLRCGRLVGKAVLPWLPIRSHLRQEGEGVDDGRLHLPSPPCPRDHFDGSVNSALRNPHGLHRKLHWDYAKLHLAVLLPSEVERRQSSP